MYIKGTRYSLVVEGHLTGVPPVRALGLEFPDGGEHEVLALSRFASHWCTVACDARVVTCVCCLRVKDYPTFISCLYRVAGPSRAICNEICNKTSF